MIKDTADVISINQDNIHLMKLVDAVEDAITDYSQHCNLSEVVGALELIKVNIINNNLYDSE